MTTRKIRVNKMIKPIVHDVDQKLWCGPAAIAAITGFRTSAIYDLLKECRGKGGITGIWNQEMLFVMRRLGYEVLKQTKGNGKPVKDFIKTIHTPAIVAIEGHYFVAVSSTTVFDNACSGPIPVVGSRVEDDIVEDAWTFYQSDRPAVLASNANLTAEGALKKARALAEKHGIQIEKDGDFWWVTCDALDHLNPFEPIAYNGHRVFEMVEAYVSLLLAETV